MCDILQYICIKAGLNINGCQPVRDNQTT